MKNSRQRSDQKPSGRQHHEPDQAHDHKKNPEFLQTAAEGPRGARRAPKTPHTNQNTNDPTIDISDGAVEVIAPGIVTPIEIERDRARRRRLAAHIVSRHANWAGATGLIPFPVVDMVSLSSVQIEMVAQLARVYNIPFSRHAASLLVGAVISGYLSPTIGSWISRVLSKILPGIGPILGKAGSVALAYSATLALGRAFTWQFEQGHDMESADVQTMRRDFAAAIAIQN